jgi:hypothetical protein
MWVKLSSSLPPGPMTTFIESSAVFGDLHTLVSNAIGVDLRGNRDDVCTFLSEWDSRDLRTDTRLMLKVEALIPEVLHQFGVSGNAFGSIQFPANIRVVQSESGYSNRNVFRTDYIHCDSWSGAPLDSYNLFVYLFVSPGSPYLRIYEFPDASHHFENRYASYAQVQIREQDLQPFHFATEAGNSAFWPTVTPHRTVVPELTASPAWRVSLDVRLRSGSPYSPDPNVRLEEFSKSRMSGGGLYWDSSTIGFPSIAEKIKRELEVAERHGSWALDVRREYLNAWYPKSEGP